MKWSLKLIEIAGIGIFVHWTFFLLLLWVAGSHIAQGGDSYAAIEGVFFVLSLFGCVVLHELGHALAARRFGISTRDITLLPFGGIARLERIPEAPLQELAVAIAGPAVNVVIAGVLWLVISATGELTDFRALERTGAPFLDKLFWVNVVLVVFNLLPAFPMDGGRVLRAFLALRLDYVRATEIAASVGQVMAILFGTLGFFGSNPMLLLVAFFVFLGAQEEAQLTKLRSAFRGVPVRQAMITRFRSLASNDPIGRAIDFVLAGSQQDFPVLADGKVIGVLVRGDLFAALEKNGREHPIADFVRRDLAAVEDSDMLDRIFQLMRERSTSTLPVVRSDELVGLITLENVGEWLLVQSATRKSALRSESDGWFSRAT
jgi:Zn-dependent protease